MIPFRPFQFSVLHGAVAAAAPVYADTVFVGAGAVMSTVEGSADIPWPAGHAAGDLGILAIETMVQTVDVPAGWTLFGTAQSFTGAGSTKLSVFMRTAASASEAAVDFSETDHWVGVILAYRSIADVEESVATNANGDVGTTSPVFSAITTTVPKVRVVYLAATSRDLDTTTTFNSWTNANLTDLTERVDRTISSGDGGGLGIADGTLAAAGSTGDGSVTLAATAKTATMTIGLMPNVV